MGNDSSIMIDCPFVGIRTGAFKDRYEIVRRLGEGHQGAAYLARRRLDGEEVVAKAAHDMSSKGRCDFFEEFENMRCFNHPNIIKVIELVEGSDHLNNGNWMSQSFLIMEFARGGSLYSYMRKRTASGQSISEEWAAGVFAGAMRGVCHLHDKGFVHNDLKPDNILMMKAFDLADGDVIPEVVIADFGSATRIIDARVSVADPRYRAPETWRALDILNDGGFPSSPTPKVDIWAMGAILFELMSGGKIPFLYKACSFNVIRESSKLREQTKKGVLSKTHIDIRAHCPDASVQLESFLKRLLAKEARFRPKAAEVLQDVWFHVKGHTFTDAMTKRLEFWDLKSAAHAILMNALAIRLTRNHTEECRKVFQSVDQNSDGSIDLDEFKAACTEMARARKPARHKDGPTLLSPSVFALDDATAESFFKKADINDDEVIDFNEFLTITFDWSNLERAHLDKTLALLVDFLDKDQDGKISKNDAEAVFEDTLPREEFDEVFGQIDLNKDGFVSAQELKSFLFGEDTLDDLVERRYAPQPRFRRGYQRFFGEDGDDVNGETKRRRITKKSPEPSRSRISADVVSVEPMQIRRTSKSRSRSRRVVSNAVT